MEENIGLASLVGLLENPERFDGRIVTVEGTVENLEVEYGYNLRYLDNVRWDMSNVGHCKLPNLLISRLNGLWVE